MSIKVCLDAGHGQANSRPNVFDPGAESGSLREADLALTLALTVKFVFAEEGIPFYMIRSDNQQPRPLRTRPTLADAAGCSHYLCLHINDGPEGAHGLEVIYRSQADRIFGMVVKTCAANAFAMTDRGMKPEDESQHSRLRVFDFVGPVAYAELGFIGSDADMAQVRSRSRRIQFAENLAAYFAGLMEN